MLQKALLTPLFAEILKLSERPVRYVHSISIDVYIYCVGATYLAIRAGFIAFMIIVT